MIMSEKANTPRNQYRSNSNRGYRSFAMPRKAAKSIQLSKSGQFKTDSTKPTLYFCLARNISPCSPCCRVSKRVSSVLLA